MVLRVKIEPFLYFNVTLSSLLFAVVLFAALLLFLVYSYDSNNFLKLGWFRKGSQAGSRRSKGIENGPGMDNKSSSWLIASSYSPTIT